MITALVFVISFLTLFQFFVSYTRSLIAKSRIHELSEQARELCGRNVRGLAGDQYLRLAQLVALCPGPGGDNIEVWSVALYFRLLGLLRVLAAWALPAATSWIDAERAGCTSAAAMVLDRRIAYGRMLSARQATR